ncbi:MULTISPECIES: glycogen/starch/alpha-glucan phosphorylase [Anaerotruncus]|jgi:starch phosphorylase|uniref:glycogen/starch/alpha-glucan phosphorylase n=1 Tax=Anaerotruncus TaxID=244127 RepID=UPI0008361DBC|nr:MULTISPECIES: glycogen/starch/alpha-glucan phosphorylase [Anaerotruncus]RGX56144.1 glycogen/starch/alpha-glucan phosphorylase [Anaerotruncus sp. AF02-27]
MDTNKHYSTEVLKNLILDTIKSDMLIDPEHASDEAYYEACCRVVREILAEKLKIFSAHYNARAEKKVYYMSMEFLMGRSLKNSLYNLDIQDAMTKALDELDIDIDRMYALEPDAGLGNGGLGRLAACYLDAMATLELPAMGYSILYEYGIFKQRIIDGWQTETPDYWLPGGSVWLKVKPDRTVPVHFGGRIEEGWENGHHWVNHVDYQTVYAVPHDMYVPGFESDGVGVLRLWKAQSPGFDMESFNRGDYVNAVGGAAAAEAISKVLYPNDNHTEGKMLRLKQQYFLVAASISDIVRRHITLYGTIDNFAEKNAVQINDTHPTLAIPELMRVLLDDCGYDWDRSWDIVTRTFAYTNHTVMSEALEKWGEDIFRNLLPRIYQIVQEIDRRFCDDLREKYHYDQYDIDRMRVIYDFQVRMANLAVIASHSVNGVSALHSQIIKDSVFHDFYLLTPYKFKNVTNGIASRRWLYQSNPGLTSLLNETIGDGWLKNMSELHRFSKFADDKNLLKKLAAVKLENKERLAKYVLETSGVAVNCNSIFDVQVKRLHEYKRQHLNALHILTEYLWLKENPNADFAPKTYIFGAKAAPGYFLAKQIIKFICTLRDLIEADPVIREKLRIVFLENYSVTISEILMPASEISEQISLAGTEASGTGNMKLMLNGAITLGTLDGANVEIKEHVGDENILIFGMTTPEVNHIKTAGYNPNDYYNRNPALRRAIDLLLSGLDGQQFPDIANSLRYNDPYMVLADFASYSDIQQEASRRYRDAIGWQRMSLMNIAASGFFCADRSIHDYSREIWNLRK